MDYWTKQFIFDLKYRASKIYLNALGRKPQFLGWEVDKTKI